MFIFVLVNKLLLWIITFWNPCFIGQFLFLTVCINIWLSRWTAFKKLTLDAWWYRGFLWKTQHSWLFFFHVNCVYIVNCRSLKLLPLVPHRRPVKFRRDRPDIPSPVVANANPFIYTPFFLSPSGGTTSRANHGMYFTFGIFGYQIVT